MSNPLRWLVAILLVVVFSLTLATPSLAQEDMCVHDGTLESLVHCVHHAAEMGHITNAGVANSLLQKAEAAQAAVERGQGEVAVGILESFVAEVQAQAGVFIPAEHAGHLIEHAEMVIAGL
jgi:hypothetical protein